MNLIVRSYFFPSLIQFITAFCALILTWNPMVLHYLLTIAIFQYDTGESVLGSVMRDYTI